MHPGAKLEDILFEIRARLKPEQTDEIAFYEFCMENLKFSEAQCFQDLWVLYESMKHGNPRGGYFVEFGASNGLFSSNTFMLDKMYRWSGILIEPNPEWHEQLEAIRGESPDQYVQLIMNVAISDKSGNEKFTITENPSISGFTEHMVGDYFDRKKAGNKTYEIEVYGTPLYSFLVWNSTEKYIDYLSVDTEGSEYLILKQYFEDLNRKKKQIEIKMITVEHNFTENREKLFSLLTANGYVRKMVEFSRWDDFYILQN